MAHSLFLKYNRIFSVFKVYILGVLQEDIC